MEKLSIYEIRTGDVVKMHPEDEITYSAHREAGVVVLTPDTEGASTLRYTDSPFRLWVVA